MTQEPRRRIRLLPTAGIATLLVVVLVAGAFSLRLLPIAENSDTTVTLPAPGTPHLVFAEFGVSSDHIFVAPAGQPDQRVLVDEIDHAHGWGINPAPAMSGTRMAYTVLSSETAPSRESPAEVWILDVETLERTRLARDADLLIAPQFADDGQALIYRRSSGGQQELVRVDLAANARHVVHAERTTFGIFPIGYAADGALVYARLSATGTDILSVREGRAPTLLFHASDDIARDWQIAPDGQYLTYLAPEEHQERIDHRTRVVRLSTGEPVPLHEAATADAGEQYGPVWTPDGSAVAIGQQADPNAGGGVMMIEPGGAAHELARPEQGFDVPLAWSPDGHYLAVRSFDGVNSAAAGSESAAVIARDGARHTIAAATEVIFIGWIARA